MVADSFPKFHTLPSSHIAKSLVGEEAWLEALKAIEDDQKAEQI